TSGCSRTPSARASASISFPAQCATPGPSDRRVCGCIPVRSIIRPRSRTTRSAGSCRTRRRRTRLTSPREFHALADAQADHRRREGRGMTTTNSFGARAPLKAAGGTFEIFRLDALERRGLPVARLPYSLRILLENLLRREDGRTVTPAEIERLARWDPTKTP